jgi:YfiH family protein
MLRTVDGVRFLDPQLPGTRAAFSTRHGGVSTGPFASLNLGQPPGDVRDEPANLEENRRRFIAAVGFEGQRVEVRQVHGTTAVEADAATKDCEADTVIARRPGLVACVRTADCCPVLLTAPSVVAAVHAGWRGCVAGVMRQAVEAMQVEPATVHAAFGPSIGFHAFEVGPEVVDAFRDRFGRRDWITSDHVNLGAGCRVDLEEAGVLREQMVFTTSACTVTSFDFFSHRRDHGITGRQVAAIELLR